MPNRKMLWPIIIVLAALFFTGLAAWLTKSIHDDPTTYPISYAFEGDSKNLNATRIVPALDAELTEGENVIWCASFQAAWKEIQVDYLSEPVELKPASPIADSLNDSVDPRPYIPEESLYTNSGFVGEGVLDEIRSDMERRFPEFEPHEFGSFFPEVFVAYAYMRANCQFTLPYAQSEIPLPFTDSYGNEVGIASFGIQYEDQGQQYELRLQPRVLFAEEDDNYELIEFAIDLDHESDPHQVILALVEPQATLAETLDYVESRIAGEADSIRPIESNDVFLVPVVAFIIKHEYNELIGRDVMNEKLSDKHIFEAFQDIEFHLNRKGAKLESEAGVAVDCAPMFYIFDRPFLIIMKTRGEEEPYFVMWVGNAELLTKFE
jgi:hypothetical protein